MPPLPTIEDEDPCAVASIGDSLRRTRVRQGLTPAEAGHALGLSKWTLTGLEDGSLPLDDVRNRAYLRVYARHLGVEVEGFLRSLDSADASGGLPRGGHPATGEDPPPAPRPRRRLVVALMVVVLLFVLIGGVIAAGTPWLERWGAQAPPPTLHVAGALRGG